MNPFVIQKKGTLDLKEFYHNNLYLYPYGRYAFLEGLLKLQIKSIYLPSFICKDMLSPLKELKIDYFFYDVNEKLEPTDLSQSCEGILFVNYFGFAQNIAPFLEYKQKHNAIIIEDNAHGFLSKDKNGTPLGTRGDLGILSIRKTFSLPNGAGLLVNNHAFYSLLFKEATIKKSEEDRFFYKKQELKKKFIHKYFGIGFVLLRRVLRYVKTGETLPKVEKGVPSLPKNRFLTPLFSEKTLEFNKDFEIERRRAFYKKVSQYSKNFDIEPIFTLDDWTVPYGFAFIDNGGLKKFERYLFTKGLFVLPWPDLPDDEKFPKIYKRIKVVPFLW